MFRYLILFFLGFSFFKGYTQEKAPERISTYTLSLNQLKTQEQVTAIEQATQSIQNVSNCKLDWINYQMVFDVKEGGDYPSFDMAKIKAILIENKAALINFEKENKRDE